MSIHLSWELITLILAVLVHAFATIRSYTRLETLVTSMTSSLLRIDKELEKRDIQITALWKRVGELRDMIKV